MIIAIILAAVVVCAISYFVGFDHGDKHNLPYITAVNKNCDEWADKALEANQKYQLLLSRYHSEIETLDDLRFADLERAAEELKDNIELERYLRDEERDVAEENYQHLLANAAQMLKFYCELHDAVEAPGNTIKSLRKRLDSGEL